MKRNSIPILILLAGLSAARGQNSSTAPVAHPATQHGKGTRILIAGGLNTTPDGNAILFSSELYDEGMQRFFSTGSMSEGRVGHQATLLKNGQVLITGGDGASTRYPVASAELYHPDTGAFTSAGSMTVERVGHTAVLLSSGLVFVAGGQDSTFTNLNTAELFDPTTGNFSPTGNMNVARTGHTATLLNNGKVLVAGGEIGGPSSSAELYDPATGAFSPTGSMSTPRVFATATLLDKGKVLIAGGGSFVGNCSGCSVASAEIYDQDSGRFMAVGNMGFARRGHIAVLLKNHKVLVAGGIDDRGSTVSGLLRSAELFDMNHLTFSPTSSMKSTRYAHAASLLRNGKVLITGGFITRFDATDTAEVFDPHRNSFVVTGTMTEVRASHSSTGPRH